MTYKMVLSKRNERKTRINKNKKNNNAKRRRNTRRIRHGGVIKYYNEDDELVDSTHPLVDNQQYKIFMTNKEQIPNWVYDGYAKAIVNRRSCRASEACSTNALFVFNGKGKLIEFLSKDEITMYNGEWVNDKKEGTGEFKNLITGETYEGEWENDKRHGHGVMKLEGTIWQCNFA